MKDVKNIEQLELPKDEKIIVRGLGEEDSKVYKNKAGAKARRKLGSDQFKKPKSEVSEDSQPIPVEYKDMLR